MKTALYLSAAVLVTSLTSARADCLDDVADFAEKICVEVRTIGKSNLVTGKGDLNAAAKELIAKALQESSSPVGAETKIYEEVLREQLGADRIRLSKCGIALARTAMDHICSKASR